MAPATLPTTPTPHKQPRSYWRMAKSTAFFVLAMLVVLTLAYVAFVMLNKEFHPSPVFGEDALLANQIVFVAHVLFSAPPLLIGIIVIQKSMRTPLRLALHRRLGKWYVYCILFGSISGLLLAISNPNGIWAQAGFTLLAITWFTTTFMAFYLIRYKKDVVRHRRWMIRSYAITCAVITVRFLFFHGPPEGMSWDVYYPIITWACWVPNLILAEIYVRVTNNAGRLKRSLLHSTH